jgi:hypothetical protein
MARRRLYRRLAWAATLVGAVVSITLLLSLPFPGALCAGSLGIRLDRGRMQLALASHPLRWAKASWWLSAAGQPCRVIIEPGSSWRPNTFNVRMMAAGPPTTLITLRIVNVPLWPWTAAIILAAGILHWRFPYRPDPDTCSACGYDMRGNPNGRCPECGRAATPPAPAACPA